MNQLNRLRQTLAELIRPGQSQNDNSQIRNKFNESFLWSVGGGYTTYDDNSRTYIEKGFEVNPIVYSVINQQATKTSAIPYTIRKVEDEKAFMKLKTLEKATNMNLSIAQSVKHARYKAAAMPGDDLDMPLEVPNANQSWTEFLALFKTFLKLTGNVYIYSLAPEAGAEAGTPISVYLLPSQDVQIVVKKDTDLMGVESPVQGYILIQGRSYIEFEATKVIHIKTPNPDYDSNGSHLYGVSPLRAAVRNIQASNSALDLNIKTLKSGGAFGFIHGKNIPMTVEQAKEIKERLHEMNDSPEDLSKIAGVSAELGFTRLSLTSDELKPFDYWNFDQKQICNVLSWSDKLLNNDAGAKYDNVSQYRKQVVTDNIVPDLELLEDALNRYWLPLFKNYQNTKIKFDVMELPEMQLDISSMSKWLTAALTNGVITRNEYREAINYMKDDNENMDVITVQSDVLTLDEALDPSFNVPEGPQDGTGPRSEMPGYNGPVDPIQAVVDAAENEEIKKILKAAKIKAFKK